MIKIITPVQRFDNRRRSLVDIVPNVTCIPATDNGGTFVLETDETNMNTLNIPGLQCERDQDGKLRFFTTDRQGRRTPKRIRIRKLTPRECGRLMGLEEPEIDRIESSGVSRSAQYKLYGNSIVVDVLTHVFRKLYCEPENESPQLTLF